MSATSTERRGPGIDPRIRDRRREVRRHEGRQRLRRLGAFAGVATLAAATGVAVLSPVLDVDRVVVLGAERTDIAEVERTSGIDVGEPMATLRLSRAARAVETLPWVAEATVTRSWPGSVVITINERTAVAIAVAGDGSEVLVDDRGRQLVIAGEDDRGDLPTIEGLDFEVAAGQSVGAGARGALELAERLRAAFDGATEAVVVDERGALEARIAPVGTQAVRVVVGTPDRIPAKVVALVSVLERAGNDVPPVVVDVRAPDAPALTRASP